MKILELVRPTYECSACGVTHASAIGLPVGWSQAAGAVWCPDCTSAGIPARDVARRCDRRAGRAA